MTHMLEIHEGLHEACIAGFACDLVVFDEGGQDDCSLPEQRFEERE